MSSYHQIYLALQAKQYQLVLLLAMVGLGWAVAWLLVDGIIPARWRVWCQWAILGLAVALCCVTLGSIK